MITMKLARTSMQKQPTRNWERKTDQTGSEFIRFPLGLLEMYSEPAVVVCIFIRFRMRTHTNKYRLYRIESTSYILKWIKINGPWISHLDILYMHVKIEAVRRLLVMVLLIIAPAHKHSAHRSAVSGDNSIESIAVSERKKEMWLGLKAEDGFRMEFIQWTHPSSFAALIFSSVLIHSFKFSLLSPSISIHNVLLNLITVSIDNHSMCQISFWWM